MDLQALWDHALKQTEIIRLRALELATFEATVLPYIFLAESSLNPGDTVVRSGKVVIEQPALVLPTPQMEGFEFLKEHAFGEDAVLNFFLVRGIRFPSLRYRHELSSLDVRDGSMADAVRHYQAQLAQAEDLHTGLVLGPEDAWQFSILILVGHLVSRSAGGDLRRLLDEWRKRQQN